VFTDGKNAFSVRRKTLLFAILLVMLLIVFSVFVYLFVIIGDGTYFFEGKAYVENEKGLINTINNATGSTVIVLNKDIKLTKSLIIPINKNITLTSENAGFCSLIGANNQSTITVNEGGVLFLDGIVITHNVGSLGRGIMVESKGKLVMLNGEITGNTATPNQPNFYPYGGGVYNQGIFRLFGGIISNNTAKEGGGVFSSGDDTFSMYGGVITNNTASHDGGGVYAVRSFGLSGGIISNNEAEYGGGVFVYAVGSFSMSGGEISGNTANSRGGGVHITSDTRHGRYGVFLWKKPFCPDPY
jgi:hypothetical protein